MAYDLHARYKIKADLPNLIQIGENNATRQRVTGLIGCATPLLLMGAYLFIAGISARVPGFIVFGAIALVLAPLAAASVLKQKIREGTLITPNGITTVTSDGGGRHEQRTRAENVLYLIVERQGIDRFALRMLATSPPIPSLLMLQKQAAVEQYAQRIGAMLKAPACVGIFEAPPIADMGAMVSTILRRDAAEMREYAKRAKFGLLLIDRTRRAIAQPFPMDGGPERTFPIGAVSAMRPVCDEDGTFVSGTMGADNNSGTPDHYRYRYHVDLDIAGLGTVPTGTFIAEPTRRNEHNDARRAAEQLIVYLQTELARAQGATPPVFDPLRHPAR